MKNEKNLKDYELVFVGTSVNEDWSRNSFLDKLIEKAKKTADDINIYYEREDRVS